MTGQRAHERFAIGLPVTVLYQGVEYLTTTRNVSLGGIFVESLDEIPFGASVCVVFRLPALTADSEIVATVRWKKPDGLGLQFGSLRAVDVWGLHQLFKSRGTEVHAVSPMLGRH